MNQQLPIKLQFVSKLVDNLNAEIVLRMAENQDKAVQRLRYMGMLQSPGLYGIGVYYQESRSGLIQKHTDVVNSAAALLEKCHLTKYECASG
ncbi:hypothetical protein JVU11DRAFT_13042 [Chiua virens]|nr:hypothetical protein JVU11DRAFT_13042 [Chiua virens]